MQTALAPAAASFVVAPLSGANVALRVMRRRWFEAHGKEEPAFPDALQWTSVSLDGRLLAVMGYLDQDVPLKQRWVYEFYRAQGLDADAIHAARTLVADMHEATLGKRKLIATLPAPGENAELERFLASIGWRCGAQLWEIPD